MVFPCASAAGQVPGLGAFVGGVGAGVQDDLCAGEEREPRVFRMQQVVTDQQCQSAARERFPVGLRRSGRAYCG